MTRVTLAAVHLSPAITIPLAVMLAAFVVWYWMRLSSEDVPDSRRRIRRASLVVMAVAIIPFIRASSMLDPDAADPHVRQEYIVTWTLCGVLLILIVGLAVLDVFNNMRLQRRHARAMIDLAARRLGQAARDPHSALAEQSRTDENDSIGDRRA
jgi:hypothetical protein